MGVGYKVEACVKSARLDYIRDALAGSGVNTLFVTEERRIHQVRRVRNIDLVGETDLSKVLLYVFVDSEDLAKKVVDLITQNATTGHPRDDGWIKYTRRDNVEPITQEYSI